MPYGHRLSVLLVALHRCRPGFFAALRGPTGQSGVISSVGTTPKLIAPSSVEAYVHPLYGPLSSSLATGNASVLLCRRLATMHKEPVPHQGAGSSVVGRTAFPRSRTLHET